MQRFLFIPILLCLIACQSEQQRAKALVAQFGVKDAARRAEASETLVAMGPDAIDALVRGVSDENPRVREMSAWTLSEIGVPTARVVPALISTLADPDENIRVMSVLSRYRIWGSLLYRPLLMP